MGNEKKMAHYEEAVKEFSRAIELSPDFTMPYLYRGEVYYKMGKFDLAIEDYTQAIFWTNAPFAIAKGLCLRGIAYYAKGEIDKAIKDFTKALQKEPEYAQVYFQRGQAYLIKNEFNLAIADCDKAIRLEPDAAGTYLVRGSAYSGIGAGELSVIDYSKAIQLDPQIGEKLAAELNAREHERSKL